MKGAESETRNTMYRVKILRGLFNSCNHRGSLPNATFGSGKNSHQPKFALAKYLANAVFGLIISLLCFFLYFAYNIKTTVMK